ncbi:MAG: Na+/H+ antiporter NhaA [Dehalococcoidia bacterium]|nr:Na+/H+ antiporter NhaA [Dehalococcoidia bacterium]
MSTLRSLLPQRILLPVQEFIQTEAAGGVVLLAAALAALVWANSPLDGAYFDLWETRVSFDVQVFAASQDLQHWVNDALMVVFFFVVGLEIKREMLHGELAGPKRAALPVAAALGGMAAPALIFAAFNAGGEGAKGWGIPIATDIAFAIGVLALLGDRIPSGLRVFLLALAIVDDIGAILVIAVFYTESLAWDSLAIAGGLLALIVAMQLAGVRNMVLYLVAGVALWAAMFESGVHATIAGVLLGLLTPSRPPRAETAFKREAESLLAQYREAAAEEDIERVQAVLGELEEVAAESAAPLERLERLLHPWSSFLVVPAFALANAGVHLSGGLISDSAASPVTWGVLLGLVTGKLAGVCAAAWLAVRLRLAEMPAGIGWTHLAGAGLLAGIGFTVSLFVTGLAFADGQLVGEAKVGILAASVIAGVAGYTFLRLVGKPSPAGGQAEAAGA